MNGEAIIINDKGLTDNCYHRLAACIQAGVPFQTVLIEGVKHETWTTIDTGKTRSAGDVFGIMGITNPTQKASIVAKYYALTKDKQKVVTDLWNKYISSKENIRVNITSAIIFK